MGLILTILLRVAARVQPFDISECTRSFPPHKGMIVSQQRIQLRETRWCDIMTTVGPTRSIQRSSEPCYAKE